MAEARGEKKPRDVRYLDGIEIRPVYGPADLGSFDYARDLGDPGDYPFTRGIHPHMYRARPFTMRQYIGFGTPAETNARFKYLMAHGQDALNVAFDLPTQLGLDSDDPRAEGEVGRVGMAVDSLLDMEEAFEGIAADRVSISFTINSMAAFIQAMFLVVAEKQGVAWDRVVTTPQNDILKEFIARGTWVYPVDPVAAPCLRHRRVLRAARAEGQSHLGVRLPHPRGRMHARAGDGLRAPHRRRGHARAPGPADRRVRAPSVVQLHGLGRLFEEVAKFRAGRRLYARMMKERFGARNPRSMMFRSLIGGGGSGFTVQEPENNIVRGAYYILAAALSGCQTSALPTYDEAYTIPSPKAQLIALRTMQICAEETGVADTVDPLAGSYFVESLTNEMEARIQAEIDRVERMGGIVEAVKAGTIQAEVARQAYRFEQMMLSGEYPKVGVNRHVAADATREASDTLELYAFDPKAAEAQVARLRRLRRERDQTAVDRTLAQLRAVARGGENLMPPILEAVRAYATLGEMAAALRDVWGEHKEPTGF